MARTSDDMGDDVVGKVEPHCGERLSKHGGEVQLLHPPLLVGLTDQAVDPSGHPVDQIEELGHLHVCGGFDSRPDLLVGVVQCLLGPAKVHQRMAVVEQDRPDRCHGPGCYPSPRCA